MLKDRAFTYKEDSIRQRWVITSYFRAPNISSNTYRRRLAPTGLRSRDGSPLAQRVDLCLQERIEHRDICDVDKTKRLPLTNRHIATGA